MIGSFKANNPRNNLLLLLYGLILNWPLLASPSSAIITSNDSFLYQKSIGILIAVTNNSIIGILTYLLLFLQAVFLNKLAMDQKLFQKNNYLTGMSYLLITSIFHVKFSASLISVSLLIWILTILFSMSSNGNAKKNIFNIGLLLGLSILIFLPSFLFLVLVLFGLLIFRPFKIQEWLIVFLGVTTPYYFVFAYGFLLDKFDFFRISMLVIKLPNFKFSIFEIVSLCTLLLILVIGFAFMQSNMRKLLVQSRNCWTIISTFFIISLCVPLFNNSPQISFPLFSFVPISVFVASAYYYPEKKWFTNLSQWILVALSILNGYFFLFHK